MTTTTHELTLRRMDTCICEPRLMYKARTPNRAERRAAARRGRDITVPPSRYLHSNDCVHRWKQLNGLADKR